ncbi:hypothetical protein [Treponema zioleckii]|uniref:hypothetical protein n=1 Tax=Treponema zioleckii TaxID=331680 RepID=UPI00168B72A9|nr:hypothetical protein [Treponema zioleckii]
MTNDELLIESLQTIQNQVKEELAEITENDKTSNVLREDYEEVLELLGYLVPKITGIDSLYEELEEDEFEFIVDCLENYQEVFVIDGRNPEKLKADEEKYSQLTDILFDLYGDDDDFSEEDLDEEITDDDVEDFYKNKGPDEELSEEDYKDALKETKENV